MTTDTALALLAEVYTDYVVALQSAVNDEVTAKDEPTRQMAKIRVDKLRAMVKRITALLSSGGWMPIETAPKGGGTERTDDPKWVDPPRILIRCGGEGCAIGYWDWYYAEGGAGCTDGVAWTENFTGDPISLHYTTPPDAWQPLPPLPKGDIK